MCKTLGDFIIHTFVLKAETTIKHNKGGQSRAMERVARFQIMHLFEILDSHHALN